MLTGASQIDIETIAEDLIEAAADPTVYQWIIFAARCEGVQIDPDDERMISWVCYKAAEVGLTLTRIYNRHK